jgi:hypothetical protein
MGGIEHDHAEAMHGRLGFRRWRGRRDGGRRGGRRSLRRLLGRLRVWFLRCARNQSRR